MGYGQVQDPSGQWHLIEIAGDKPTPEEQAKIDAIAGLAKERLGGVTPTLPNPATMDPQSILRGEARTAERAIRSGAADARNEFSALSGMAGGVSGFAFGGPVGAAVGAGVGSALGPLIGRYSNDPRSSAARKAGLTPSDNQIYGEMFTQGGLSLGIDAAGATLGKMGKGFVGIGNREQVIKDLDEAAEVGIRVTAGDLSRSLFRTGRKVVSIIPILGVPFRGAERNRGLELYSAIQRLRGPLSDIASEPELSADLLKAAAGNFENGIPWYKMFYKEAEDHAKATNLNFNIQGAVDKAIEFNQAVERGRRILNRTTQRQTETVTQRQTEFARDKRIDQQGRIIEGTVTETGGPAGPTVTPVGPEARVFEATPQEFGLSTQSRGATSTTARTLSTTTRTERGAVRNFTDANEVSDFIEELQFTNPNVNFWQYDNILKEIDEAWKVGSNTQRIALTEIREQIELAARNTGDERFNFLYNTAKENFKVLKEWSSNPQARKFQLIEEDVFSTAFRGSTRSTAERKEVSQLFKTVFDPDMGPDGIRHVIQMVGRENADKGIRLSIRQRLDKHIVDPEDGKINWHGLYTEFGLNDTKSLRYQTFDEMLKNSTYGMDAETFTRQLDTLQRYIGDRLPELSTQLIRSISIGNTGSALRNITGSRVFNTSDGPNFVTKITGEALGKLIFKGMAVFAIFGVRSFTNFLADPDKLRVLMRYVDEGQVPIPGAALPMTKAGMPVPGISVTVGSGARQTYLAAKKPAVRIMEKQMMKWLATDMANSISDNYGEALFKAAEILSYMERGYENPENVEKDLENLVNETSKSVVPSIGNLFQQHMLGRKPQQ